MNQPSAFPKISLFAGMFLLLLCPALVRAQNICDKMPDTTKPCLYQPHENEMRVTGRLSLDAMGHPVTGAIVEIEIGGNPAPSPATVNVVAGTFMLNGLPPLVPGTLVHANQIISAPAPGSLLSTGDLSVAPSANNLCTAAQPPKAAPAAGAAPGANAASAGGANQTVRNIDPTRPCLSQPNENDQKVTGLLPASVFTAKPAKGVSPIHPGTVVDIKIAGVSVGSAQLNNDGSFVSDKLHTLSQYDTVQADLTSPAPGPGQPVPSSGPVSVAPAAAQTGSISSKYTLGLVGINVSGTSSSGPSQQYFASFELIAPLKWVGPACFKDGPDPIQRRCWVWINPKIASLPSAATTALSSLNSASLTTAAGGQTIGQITQSLEAQAGLEYYLFRPGGTGGQYWGLGKSWAQSTVSLIGGGGLVTPLNSISAAPEFGLSNNLGLQFNQQPTLASTYPQLAQALCSYGYTPATGAPACPSPLPTAKPTIAAFVFPNRSRFYRDWFAGLRLRFWYFSGDCSSKSRTTASCSPDDVYPGTLDFRFGQDETVTGGVLSKTVMTLAGDFPVPGTQGILRVFGSAYMKLSTNQNTTALVAIPVTTFTTLDNSTVVVQQVPRSDQDYFRLGVGVDLIAALSKVFPGNATTPAAAAGK